uniref:Uncharacterized protein n=1 Tax=Xenopus tropicalis TaxID=8364 RepID=A0A803JHB1_XENTR
MADSILGKDLTCFICWGIYTDPITLPCGHNFCRGCIGRTWDGQKSKKLEPFCPKCKRRYNTKPELKRNLRLSNIAEQFLRGNRKCSAHNEPLKYHCCEDGAPICVSCCLAGGHRGHRVELLSEASEKKKEKLREVLEKLSQEREETERQMERLQERRAEVRDKIAAQIERFSNKIRGENEKLTELIQQLEIKKDELSRKIRHIEELCNMADPLTVLQEQWESHGAAFCGAEGADTEGREREGTEGADTEGADTEGREREDTEGADTEGGEREGTEGADTEGRERENTEGADTEGADTEGREREDTEGADTEGGEREGTEGADTEGGEREDIKDLAVGDLDVGRISETLLTGLAGIVTGVKGRIYGQEATELELDTNMTGNTSKIPGKTTIVKASHTAQRRNNVLTAVKGPVLTKTELPKSDAEKKHFISDHFEKNSPIKECPQILWPKTLAPFALQTLAHKERIFTVYPEYISVLACLTPEKLMSCDPAGNNTFGKVAPSISQPAGERNISPTGSAPDSRSDPVYGQEATELVLDTNMAGYNVSVSGYRKSASMKNQRLLHPIRFRVSRILSTRSFPSGRHYWEVEGSESGDWGVGAAYPRIRSRGFYSFIQNNNNSWCLFRRRNNKYSVMHGTNVTPLPHVPSCRRIRISLDYEAGRLSFYELSEPIRHLHTFTASFTEPLHAAFWVHMAHTWVRIITDENYV